MGGGRWHGRWCGVEPFGEQLQGANSARCDIPNAPRPTSNLNELQAVRRIRKAHVSAVSQPYFRRSEAPSR